ncbi:MAG: endonuclease domain-containing protein [Oscillospiraceae bacterium]|nr:endonuclease domain-containing protein [Oscillospiraceae bacterium]
MQDTDVGARDYYLMRARELRRDMTPEEKTLWYQFLRHHPLHWYRQRVIGEYIVDFYCRSASLVVEVDGCQHGELDARYADQLRDQALGDMGIRVLRFTNVDVRYHFRQVCSVIGLAASGWGADIAGSFSCAGKKTCPDGG